VNTNMIQPVRGCDGITRVPSVITDFTVKLPPAFIYDMWQERAENAIPKDAK